MVLYRTDGMVRTMVPWYTCTLYGTHVPWYSGTYTCTMYHPGGTMVHTSMVHVPWYHGTMHYHGRAAAEDGVGGGLPHCRAGRGAFAEESLEFRQQRLPGGSRGPHHLARIRSIDNHNKGPS